jgi:thioredoxin-like negative regulator of GroEL
MNLFHSETEVKLNAIYSYWIPIIRIHSESGCQHLPIVDELAEELKGRAALATVNVDAEGELDAQYGVNSVPTLILFKNGEIVDKMVGLRSKSDLKSKIISHLNKSNQTCGCN